MSCLCVCVFLCCWPGVCLTAGSPVSAGLRVWLSLRILGQIRGLTLSSVVMLHVVQHYSTSGRRRTWDPASQAGVVLNFLDSCRFTFLSAVKKAVQSTSSVSRMRCRTMSFQICSYLQLSSQDCSSKL